VQLFLKVADGQIPSSWFLLGFCMHTLRYPEVHEHLLKEYQDGYTRVQKSFDDLRTAAKWMFSTMSIGRELDTESGEQTI
jgi:hypothetical protein